MPTSRRISRIRLRSSGIRMESTTKVPLLIISRQLIQRIRVDLPDPEGPIITTTSPSSMAKLMLCRTCVDPNDLQTSSISIMGGIFSSSSGFWHHKGLKDFHFAFKSPQAYGQCRRHDQIHDRHG